jgi:hypothetical protein
MNCKSCVGCKSCVDCKSCVGCTVSPGLEIGANSAKSTKSRLEENDRLLVRFERTSAY